MPLSRTTDRTLIETKIGEVRSDGDSPIEAIEQFDGPTIFYNDNDTGEFYGFTKRRDFLFWSWASSPAAPGAVRIAEVLNRMFLDKSREYSASLPFVGLFSERCPWAQRFVLRGRDTTIVDDIVASLNLITPGSAFRVNPAQRLILNRPNSDVNFGLVWGLTLPFRADVGDEDQKQEFEIKRTTSSGGRR